MPSLKKQALTCKRTLYDMNPAMRGEELSMKQTIVLCGFMGCGKTTVGKRLAQISGREFIDIDQFIEKNADMTVSEIFEKLGESHFRQLEQDAVQSLAPLGNLVVATGGGTLTFPRNTDCFRSHSCLIVMIDAPLDELTRRLAGNTARPLLNRPDQQEYIQKLYEERLPKYRAAAAIIVSSQKTFKQTARAILRQVKASSL